MARSSINIIVVIFAVLCGTCSAIFGASSGKNTPDDSIRERERREPMMPFLGFPSPMQPGYRGRGVVMPEYNETYKASKAYNASENNETYVYESEHFEPTYCEVILIDGLTRALQYVIAYDLPAYSFGKLKKRRYAVKVTSIVPEAVYEALYQGKDVVETLTQKLAVQYNFIPVPADAKSYLTKQFNEKSKYIANDVLNGICKYNYCCLRSYDNTQVEYPPPPPVL